MSEVRCPWCNSSIDNDVDAIDDLLSIQVRSIYCICNQCSHEIAISFPLFSKEKCVVEKVEI